MGDEQIPGKIKKRQICAYKYMPERRRRWLFICNLCLVWLLLLSSSPSSLHSGGLGVWRFVDQMENKDAITIIIIIIQSLVSLQPALLGTLAHQWP